MSEAATTNRPNLNLWNALEPEALGIFLDDKFAPCLVRFNELMAAYKRFLAATNNDGVANDVVAAKSTDFIKQLKGHIKEVEEVRTAVKAPVLAAQRQIDGKGRTLTEPMVNASVEVESRLGAFLRQKEIEARRAAAEEAARKEAEVQALLDHATETGDEAFVGQAEDVAAEVEVALKAATAPVDELTRLRASFGTASLRDNWVYDVVDITKVPAAYLQINDAVVKAAIRSGVRQIDGLVIRNEPKAAIR